MSRLFERVETETIIIEIGPSRQEQIAGLILMGGLFIAAVIYITLMGLW